MNRPATLTLVLTSVALLAGCTSMAPPEPPAIEADLPESWTAAPEEAADADELSIRWWSEFEDPQLDSLIEQVLIANNDLAAAAARVDAAVAQARIAGADLYPQVGVGLDGNRSRRNFIGFPIPGNDSGVLSSTSTTVGANLNVSWEADLWGRLRAGRSSARESVAAAEADLASAQLSLTGQAAKAWFAAAEARLQLELAEETFASRRLTRERIRRRYELGTREALDLRQALTNESNAEATLATRERQLDAAERQLELLLSRYPGRSTPAASVEALPEPPTGLPPLLPSELVVRRPDLAAVESRLSAAGFDIKEARASLYPRLSLTGSTGRVSEEIEDLLESDFSVWSLAANLLQPVFQGGRLRAGVDLTEARYRALAEGYAQSVLVAFAEVELALTAEATLAREAEALERSVKQSVAAQKLAEDRYGAGLADFLTVLQSQRDANLTQVALLAVQRQRLDARVDLYLALGGGFDASESPSPPSSSNLEAERNPSK